MTTDTLDELAAFGHAGEPADLGRTLTDLVDHHPMTAVLAAAAAGAGLMALVALMARRPHDPLAPVPLVASRGVDFDALKRQISDLADRIGNAAPLDAAKQRVGHASDAITDGWQTVRDQALDAIGRFEPQASAAVKSVRENPVLTALIVGAVGALVGSQLLGKMDTATDTTGEQTDASAGA